MTEHRWKSDDGLVDYIAVHLGNPDHASDERCGVRWKWEHEEENEWSLEADSDVSKEIIRLVDLVRELGGRP